MKQAKVTLAVASRNRNKVNELERIFSQIRPDVEWTFLSADDLNMPDVEETGKTFMDNAIIKAISGAKHSGRICIGEDSGLEVDVLGGAPGVHSHRFSETGSDDDNNRLLLDLLKDVPPEKRTCRYTCAIAIADAQGVVGGGEGHVEGIVDVALRGTNGFGYDPLFYSPELGKTFGEASSEEKDRVSHRRRAIENLLNQVKEEFV